MKSYCTLCICIVSVKILIFPPTIYILFFLFPFIFNRFFLSLLLCALSSLYGCSLFSVYSLFSFSFFVKARNGGLGFAVGKWWFGLGLADLGVVVVDSVARLADLGVLVVDSVAGLADLGLDLPISAWWWLIRWLGLRWVWLFADLDVVVWACAAEIGLVWWLGLGFRCTAWWWLTAWAWVHRMVVGFSGFAGWVFWVLPLGFRCTACW